MLSRQVPPTSLARFKNNKRLSAGVFEAQGGYQSAKTCAYNAYFKIWFHGCGDVGMWGCGDVGMWGCGDVGMW
jgi:hypothetical protein